MQLGGAILGKPGPFAALLTTLKTVSGAYRGNGGRWESRVNRQKVPGAVGEPLDCFISIRHQSLLPVYTEGLHGAQALISCTLWPTPGSLPYWGLYSRAGLGDKCAPSHCSRVIWQGRCQQMLIFRCPSMAVSPPRPHSPRQQLCALSSLMCDPAACIILQGVNRRLKGRLCGHCFQYPSR